MQIFPVIVIFYSSVSRKMLRTWLIVKYIIIACTISRSTIFVRKIKNELNDVENSFYVLIIFLLTWNYYHPASRSCRPAVAVLFMIIVWYCAVVVRRNIIIYTKILHYCIPSSIIIKVIVPCFMPAMSATIRRAV